MARVLVVPALFAAPASVGAGCSSETDALMSPSAQRGKVAAAELGCASCHSADGSAAVGPSWAGIWGESVTLDDGTVALVDDEYVRRSVRDPATQRRPGNWIQMPAFTPSLVSETDLDDIIEYLRHLADERGENRRSRR